MANKDIFREHTSPNTPEFSLKNVQCYVRVVDCYDGDTITVIVPIFERFFKFYLRLIGIDTCEVKSKMKANKAFALKAKSRLIELITGKHLEDVNKLTRKHIQKIFEEDVFLVWIRCDKNDKYGRPLANIRLTEQSTDSFSDILVREHLGYVYNGCTKLTEYDQVHVLQQ
jgi:endonuclease YncB( thermonuclease family)